MGGDVIQTTKFADNQAILAGSARSLQIMVKKVCDTAKKFGTKVNTAKTKVMVVAKNERSLKITVVGVEQVSSVRYLGLLISEDARSTNEINTRIAVAKAAFRTHQGILMSKKRLSRS